MPIMLSLFENNGKKVKLYTEFLYYQNLYVNTLSLCDENGETKGEPLYSEDFKSEEGGRKKAIEIHIKVGLDFLSKTPGGTWRRLPLYKYDDEDEEEDEDDWEI